MRVRREVDRLNSANILTTSYSYDSRNNLRLLVDAEGHPTRFTYDLSSRLLTRERALSIGAGIEDFVTKIQVVRVRQRRPLDVSPRRQLPDDLVHDR